MGWLLWLACAEKGDSAPGSPVPVEVMGAESDAAYVPLAGPRLLRRASLDLRGVLPEVGDLDAVEEDRASFESLRDGYLGSPELETRLVALLEERWGTESDAFLLSYWEYYELGTNPTMEYPFERAVGQEPLRLMAWVATHDRSWDEIVTADYTLSNEILGAIWPLDYPEGGEGWQVSRYTDGRPAAGILATNGLWWRYYTTVSNVNRGRAAMIAEKLLCVDYLSRPISFSGELALTDPTSLESALHENPYCLSCHASLDPIASSLFGFWARQYSTIEMDHYHAERELLGEMVMGTSPGFYGQPIQGLPELGQVIAEDPRFSRCAAQSFAELLWHRKAQSGDHDRIEGFREAFEGSSRRVPELLAAITDSPVYQAGGLSEAASEDQLGRENTLRLMTAPLLRSVIADLTGFTWTRSGFDQLDNDTFGYRVLGGGVDGSQVTWLQQTPGLTWALVVRRFAQAASRFVVEQDFSGSPRLLTRVTAQTSSSDPAFSEQLDALYWQLYAERPDATWRANITALWETIAGADGTTAAWAGVLATMLQDPLFVGY